MSIIKTAFSAVLALGAMAAGASAYIAKPYSPRDLLALIHTFLAER